MKKWKLKKSEPLFKSKWMSLYSNSYKLPNGKVIDDYLHLDRADYVLVLAVRNGKELLVEKQYRRGVDEFNFELPAGWIDKDESPLNAASRELKEETGYEGRRGRVLSELYAQPAFCSMKAHVVLLEVGGGKPQKQKIEDDENIEFYFIEISKVKEMIKKGGIIDMGFLSAFSLLLLEME